MDLDNWNEDSLNTVIAEVLKEGLILHPRKRASRPVRCGTVIPQARQPQEMECSHGGDGC